MQGPNGNALLRAELRDVCALGVIAFVDPCLPFRANASTGDRPVA
jgi:hypothetical protein